jgi:hypothetical protein
MDTGNPQRPSARDASSVIAMPPPVIARSESSEAIQSGARRTIDLDCFALLCFALLRSQ